MLGLAGAVTRDQFDALYGPGGAKDPTTGQRLVSTKRPGMELVIAAHKSVAELGVMGRAEDMHRIMDAERHATLAYLDRLTCDVGGRRGRAGTPTPTSGLVYAVTRHATSRAGDPNPHDHVLIANVLRMRDEHGGWKAATTALWREHLQAAHHGRAHGRRLRSPAPTGSFPTAGPQESSATGPSPACPRKSWPCTPSEQRKSPPRWTASATTPTRPRASSLATPGPRPYNWSELPPLRAEHGGTIAPPTPKVTPPLLSSVMGDVVSLPVLHSRVAAHP
ncbi:MAG: relaxase domain-containing protein [Actinomycetota bacterium]|nr:relaxase domain-containing protein [Actinomycetota bacterium]